MKQITTITFFRYETFSNKYWAFQMMGIGFFFLRNIDGLTFYKLLGSGKGKGFNPFPDWSVYGLLQVWESETAANEFMKNSKFMAKARKRTTEVWTLYLKNIISKGEWSKQTPFERHSTIDKNNKLICVITRATIKPTKLIRFWKYVPTAQKPINETTKGLIFTKGIGEIPIIQMATFSVWDSFKSVKAYAYDKVEHRKAIEMTRQLNWYSEELFARFQPYRSVGTWNGITPLNL